MNALVLDWGLKRMGIALCINSQVAIPLQAILRKNRNQAANELKKLLKEYQISLLLVGKGSNSDESMQKRIKHFISLLDFKGEICFIDESFTSKDVSKLRSLSTQKDGKSDSLAALLMAKDYFGLL
ncbi:Holliday junction resolvase RuvX [Campylobacter sp. MIT 97-5078]|uniref:Holliday junction resolvase RuvX n=1 Tax=Campylobacter sp. MIT 97-5078 TaxID=1548153 RepID=UPI000513D5AB|nr:Holliday junction resolvase RuvX [Campylobacter sp. MIT 97-5078]KGI55392.1 Holliday junction resolvase [Campylobacter sp. MIT 97-5078]TQR27948.1 Holliday junction resolvase RuvX [Campylobacter sp. MIT 97-5078]